MDFYPQSLTEPTKKQKIHDINPGIASNGLFWTVPMPEDALHLSEDGLVASVHLRDFPVQDQPNFPNTQPTYPARISMDLTWQAVGRQMGINDPMNHYRLQFHKANAQVALRVTVPEVGFTFTSAPAKTSETVFAMLGYDRNGLFY
ncbi:MAG: hypothetical protein NVS4B11_35200 [Ktedonobacteraceae bacterium]